MRVYFWVRSQLGESERKLLREAGGSSDVSLLTCSIYQVFPVTPVSGPEGLPVWGRGRAGYTAPPGPQGQSWKGRTGAVGVQSEGRGGFLEELIF